MGFGQAERAFVVDAQGNTIAQSGALAGLDWVSGVNRAIAVDQSGNVGSRITSVSTITVTGTQVSGAVQVSGTVAVSGAIQVLSGQIFINSGFVQTSSGSVTSAQVSGTVAISGQVQVLSGQIYINSGFIQTTSGGMGAITGLNQSGAWFQACFLTSGAAFGLTAFSGAAGLMTVACGVDLSGGLRPMMTQSGSQNGLLITYIDNAGNTVGVKAAADALAGPNTIPVTNLNEIFNGTNWDRIRAANTAQLTSGLGLVGVGNMGYSLASGLWERLMVNQSGGGAMVVATSGSQYLWSNIISGTITNLASGIVAATVSGIVGVSGVIQVSSGQIYVNSGFVQLTSGSVVNIQGAGSILTVFSGPWGGGAPLINSSGTATLGSGVISRVTLSYNWRSAVAGDVYISSNSGALSGPTSGVGYLLASGTPALTLNVGNLNALGAWAQLSGILLSAIAEKL